MIFFHGWQSLRQTFPVRKSEWVCSLVLLAVSMIIALQPDLFDNPSYFGMARYAPQWFWQWALFVIGTGRLIVLTVNGMWWQTPMFRATAAFVSCFAWWQICAGIAPNFGIGLAAFGGWFVMDAVNFKQALTESGVSLALRAVERGTART